MAIERVAFTNTTSRATMYNDLYNFLSTYATDYFDEITKDDGSNFIYCIIDNVNVITFKCVANGIDILSTTAGRTTNVPGHANYVTYFTSAYVTSKGFALTPASYSYNTMLFVYKNTDGGTAVAMNFNSRSDGSTSQGSATKLVGNFNDTSFLTNSIYFNGNTSTYPTTFPSAYIVQTIATSATSLAPVCTSGTGDTIADGLFVTPFTKYRGAVGIIELDGKRYIYDGAFALEE